MANAKRVVRLRDLCTGHGCWPPRPNDEASPNVFINRRGAHRLRDHWEVHCCGGGCHDGRAASGSRTVYVNSRPLCRIGDKVDCCSNMMTGSPNVFAGD